MKSNSVIIQTNVTNKVVIFSSTVYYMLYKIILTIESR